MTALRLALGLLALLAMLSPALSVSLGEFDSTVQAFEDFTALLETHAQAEQETDAALGDMGVQLGAEEDVAMLEAQAEQFPTYSLPYPAVGGHPLFHPYSAVNPLAAGMPPVAPLAPLAPVQVMSAAAFAASPLSGYYAQAVAAQHAALGVNAALYPAGMGPADTKGGYNQHGLAPSYYGYHPGLSNDLTSLGGRPAMGAQPLTTMPTTTGVPGLMELASQAAEGELEAEAGQEPTTAAAAAGNTNAHLPENVAADAAGTPYGLFPAPNAAAATAHYVRSASYASLGPHKLQFAAVGSNAQLDPDFPAFVESDAEASALLESHSAAEAEAAAAAEAQNKEALEAEALLDENIKALLETEVEAEAQTETEAEAESEGEAHAEAEAEAEEDLQLVETAQAPGAGADATMGNPANPTYVLPYPPVLPGHYTPLFNPYSNVNPLSTPFANYAAQPGAHPGVAAASAAQAAGLAAANAGVAGAVGAYPAYPFAAPAAAAAAVPFSGYAGWIHPSNLNNARVGDNPQAASLGQFIELSVQAEYAGCKGCEFEGQE